MKRLIIGSLLAAGTFFPSASKATIVLSGTCVIDDVVDVGASRYVYFHCERSPFWCCETNADGKVVKINSVYFTVMEGGESEFDPVQETGKVQVNP